jgi:hypothetical protein
MQTLNLHPQYVKGEHDEPLGVFLTVAEFQSILDELEELEDIKAADAYESRQDKEFLPIREALDEIKDGLVK